MKTAAYSTVRRVLCALIVSVMVLCAVVPVLAADVIDVDQTGEVTFKITSSENEGEVVGGGSIAIYKVATVDKYGVFTPLPEYASLEIDINALQDTDESWSTAADNIVLYIKNHGLEDTGTVIEFNEYGQASISGLTTGLYVALQKEAPEHYNPFKPFIIPIPYKDNKGEINYVLIAYPKGTSRLPADECVVDIPSIRKTIKGEPKPLNTEFQFRFRSLEKGYPEIVNKSGSVENGGDVVSQSADEIVLRTVGSETVNVGKITFDKPGDYFFEVSEVNTWNTNYKYDKSVYWCRYSIRLNEERNALVISNILIKRDNVNGEVIYDGEGPITFTFDFVNYYNDVPPPPPPDLPQTGQVWWPMIALAAAGIAFIFAGVIVSRRSRKNK